MSLKNSIFAAIQEILIKMRRKIYEKLLSWKQDSDHKPLVLNGARQVGKTWIVTEFGKTEYQDFAYVNCLEGNAMRELVERDADAVRILQGLKAFVGKDIVPGRTLVFVDEVQEAVKMLPALKSFNERIPELDVIVAGSLLGVTMHEGVSYPVGKVDELMMFPMDFEEFLWGMGETHLADLIKDGDANSYAPFHDQLNDWLKNYFFVGGLPEAVKDFAKERSYIAARRRQNAILSGYSKDFSKHVSSEEMTFKISLIWKTLPSQIAKENKKFIFNAIKPSARARDYETSVGWLEDAGLAVKVTRLTEMKQPAGFYHEEGSFKLFPLDCGLLGAMMGVNAKDVVMNDNIFTEYKGAFTETFVHQQLKANYEDKIYYYGNDTSTAEIDFVVEADKLVPIEVKGGRNLTAKSMVNYLKKTPGEKGYRFSDKPAHEGGMIIDMPLYDICSFARDLNRRSEAANCIHP